MPSLKQGFNYNGPMATVMVGLSLPREQALLAAGKQLPPPQFAIMLIDTGASGTCIDPTVITPLNLTPTGTCSVITPSTGASTHTCLTYDVGLIFGNHATPLHFPTLAINVCDFSMQGIHGLLGRDVLAKCVLIYDGERSEYILSY